MTSSPPPLDRRAVRLRATEEALHKVQAQAAALEGLSEELSLAVHTLEAGLGALAEEVRADAARQTSTQAPASPEWRAPERARSTDADGARLVALNMALDGDPREAADRYLQEHFDIPERERLLDEVYAAAGR